MYFLCTLQIYPKNSDSKIFSDQLSISQTLKHSFTLESKEHTHLSFSAHNEEIACIKVTNFIMLEANDPNTFNIIAEEYHHHYPLLELPISYVKHYSKFFSLAFNHFSVKSHLPISMNNNFMKKMLEFNETVQVLMYNFFILGFFLFYEIKFLINKFKTKEKKKQKNILIFVMFFMNSYQIFHEGNSTLSIINSNEFKDINQYKNNTKFITISENIYEIPSGSFSEWPLVVSVNFGNSVSNIGNSVFSSCFNLEIIIFGENVTTIGESAFSSCSSIKNITIPNSVTAIGNSAFSLCSNLTILTLGYGIREIGGSAFGNCYNLQCIYYYGDNEPDVSENAFSNVFASVITYSTYKSNKFGSLDVDIENTEGICEPIPTHSFSQSNTFPNSNTFTASLQSDISLSLSFSYTFTVTLSITHSLTIYETQTKTFSLYINNSTFSYIETEFIYYSYTIVIYSTYYNYYSNFFTMFHTSDENSPNGITTNVLIGIICGSFAFVLIIIGIVIFLVKSNNKKEKSKTKLQFKDTTTSSTKQIEEVNSLVEDIVKEDEDNWL